MKNGNWIPLSFLSPVISMVALSIIYWGFVMLPKYIRNRRAVKAGAREARMVERERVSTLQKMQEIYMKLDAEVGISARTRTMPEKKTLYANKETGTVVFQVFTSNAVLPYPVNENPVWSFFLIGNIKGFIATDEWLDSEAEVDVAGVVENEKSVTIKLNSFKSPRYELRQPVKDMVFHKARFKPYPVSKKA